MKRGLTLILAACMGCAPTGPTALVRPTPLAEADFASVRFRAEVYELRLPQERAAALDPDRLAAAAGSRRELLNKLKQLGTAKLLYQVDQAVDLNTSTPIRVGARVPFVMAARPTQTGQVIRTVRYEQMGAEFNVAGKPVTDVEAPVMRVQIDVEISAISDSGAHVSEKVPARVMRKVTLAHRGAVTLGRPITMMSMDSSAPAKDERAVAFVVRIVLDAPPRPHARQTTRPATTARR